MKPSPSPDRELLIEIARLYYLRDLTHDQIGHRMGMSRVKVTRLLQRAKAEGIIEFRIADPSVDAAALAEALEKTFALRRAIITPAGQDDPHTRDILGRLAAEFLTSQLPPQGVLGLGWGRTLNAMAGHLVPGHLSRLTVVSLSGGMAATGVQPNPYDVATAVAARLGGRPRYLLLPAVVDSVEARDVLLRQRSSRAIQALWQQLDICMLSIGAIPVQTGVFASLEDPSAAVAAARNQGAVGDLLTRPFDVNGQFVSCSFADCTIGIPLEMLKKVPLVVGVAGGASKVRPVLGALRTGILNTVIVDDRTARAALAMA